MCDVQRKCDVVDVMQNCMFHTADKATQQDLFHGPACTSVREAYSIIAIASESPILLSTPSLV
jgi:hypothetical protein